jgi:hypothetical protein
MDQRQRQSIRAAPWQRGAQEAESHQIVRKKEMKIFYFGCIDQAGHYLWAPGPRSAYRAETPWGPHGWGLDGTLHPKGQGEGVAALVRKDGWTAIAFIDYSIDSRPGSNSVFLAEGNFTFAEMLQHAHNYFPSVMDRFGFKITEYKATDGTV